MDYEETPLGLHQLTVRYIMDRDTLWSILLVHGTGVGKTFSCIAIAENSMGHFSGKTLVVAPEVTHNQYIKSILKSHAAVYKSGEEDSVKERYDMTTYESLHKYDMTQYKCIILDEAHNIRNTDGNVYAAIDDMRAKISPKRTKLVLATATPMFDRSENIFPLLELLAWNNGDKELATKLANKNISGIREACKFVSYVEAGQNDFAERRDPRTPILKTSNESKLTMFGSAIPPSERKWVDTIPFPLAITFLDKKQTDYIDRAMKATNPEDIEDAIDNANNATVEEPGSSALDSVKHTNVQYENLSVLRIPESFQKNVYNLCPKVKTIINAIKTGPRPVLVHSRYFSNGILPVLIALENEGFVPKLSAKRNRYGKTNVKTPVGTYSVVTSNVDHTDRPQLVTKTVEETDVICITDKASTGFDLRGIRQIHTLEPWWNVSKTLQTIGRAFRFKAHAGLPEKERWCEIYCHVAMRKDNRETPDEMICRKSASKYVNVLKYTDILKRNAMDCNLFKDRNEVASCGSGVTYKDITDVVDTHDSGKLEDLIYNTIVQFKQKAGTGETYTIDDIIKITQVPENMRGVILQMMLRISWPNYFDVDRMAVMDRDRLHIMRMPETQINALKFDMSENVSISPKVVDVIEIGAKVSPLASVSMAMTNVDTLRWRELVTICDKIPVIRENFEKFGLIKNGILMDVYTFDGKGYITSGVRLSDSKDVGVSKFSPFNWKSSDIPETINIMPSLAKFVPSGKNIVIRGVIERKNDRYTLKVLKRDGSKFGRELQTESIPMLQHIASVIYSLSNINPNVCLKVVSEIPQMGRIYACSHIVDILFKIGSLEFIY